jgi:uncharacterized membrane protein HdeD (DUF308 family)
MNSLVGQHLWKCQLAAGLLTIVLGAIVLAWPGPTILVASTLFGVYLLLSGLAGLFMAFTLPRSAATRGVTSRNACIVVRENRWVASWA